MKAETKVPSIYFIVFGFPQSGKKSIINMWASMLNIKPVVEESYFFTTFTMSNVKFPRLSNNLTEVNLEFKVVKEQASFEALNKCKEIDKGFHGGIFVTRSLDKKCFFNQDYKSETRN